VWSNLDAFRYPHHYWLKQCAHVSTLPTVSSCGKPTAHLLPVSSARAAVWATPEEQAAWAGSSRGSTPSPVHQKYNFSFSRIHKLILIFLQSEHLHVVRASRRDGNILLLRTVLDYNIELGLQHPVPSNVGGTHNYLSRYNSIMPALGVSKTKTSKDLLKDWDPSVPKLKVTGLEQGHCHFLSHQILCKQKTWEASHCHPSVSILCYELIFFSVRRKHPFILQLDNRCLVSNNNHGAVLDLDEEKSKGLNTGVAAERLPGSATVLSWKPGYASELRDTQCCMLMCS